MGDTDTDRFDIYFSGECLEGHEESAVRHAVARLFRADDATLEKLFSGKRQRIKRAVDRATALKYHKALETAGAKAIVERSPGAGPERQGAAGAPAHDATAPARSATQGAVLSLGAAGEDLLRPEERPAQSGAAPPTEHLSLASIGELPESARGGTPTVEAPDFALAAAGSDLSDADPTPPPATPDVSSISVKDGEFDLSDCVPAPEPAPNLDLSHLTVDATGSDLIRDDERPRRESTTPDTSHLRLEDSDDA